MRAIWTGTISFGLVTIPISLHRATREEELRFRLLRKKDLSPVNYKRFAEVDNKEVPWDEIVKGYEYEKDKFVVLKDEDFKRVDIEATQSVDIIDFVDLKEINPMFFSRPYYIEPLKNADKPYVLLRNVLSASDKVGIAKVVIKTRQHLAAVKTRGTLLVLELMNFADELVDVDEVKSPKEVKPTPQETAMAEALVNSMTDKWEPDKYTDDYRKALLSLIHKKVKSGGKELPEPKAQGKKPTNVIDLVEVLKQSLKEAGSPGKSARKKTA